MGQSKNQKQLNLWGKGKSISIEVEKPELREYQLEGVKQLREYIDKGILRIILTMPTGGGKTVVAAHIISLATELGRRVLFIAHREELINQTAIQLSKFGVVDIGVIRANDERANPEAPVQIASIATLVNREWPRADIVIIDECHRALAESYLKLFAHYNEALHIGLTATPFRIDNQGLGEVYNAISVCAKPSQLIKDGFIESPRIFRAPTLVDLSSVEFSFGASDYHNGQLAGEMMKPKLMGDIVDEWERHAEGRKTVCFAVNIDHSRRICDVFKARGIHAAHLDGKTSSAERSDILAALETGKLSVVVNCDVLCEGWDQPSVKCAILARPTASLRLHLQQCGRILRPYKGITALILDHAGNCMRHGFPQTDREFALSYGSSRKYTRFTVHTCMKCYAMWHSGYTCPECGTEIAVEDRKPIEEDTSVSLMEVDVTQIQSAEDQERYFFLNEIARCRARGMKPGAAAYKFKEKYGRWPRYSWSAHAKVMFAADPEWQKTVETRSKTRDFWKSRNQDAQNQNYVGPQQATVDHSGFTEEPKEDEHAFYDLVEDEIPF